MTNLSFIQTTKSQNLNNKSGLQIDSGFISVKNGELYYEIAGAGEYIVLLHDGMVDHQIWDEQFPLLVKNYRVVRYDRRAYGKSSDLQSNYSPVEDLNQVFIQLKIDKAIVFGMSAGGGLAIDFALKYPDKVDGLVLVGAVVSGYGYSHHMKTRGGRIDNSYFSDQQKLLRYMIDIDPYEIYGENVFAKEKVKKIFGTNPRLNRENGFIALRAERPAVKFLSEIKVPTLILVGEFDIPDVHAHAGVIEAGITNAKREIISKAGHLVPIEQPAAFNEVVFKFLYKSKFNNLLNSEGINSAIAFYKTLYEKEPSVIILQDNEIRQFANEALDNNKFKDAIEIGKLYILIYPKSEYAYALLGEAYFKDGQEDKAVENLKKALEINPKLSATKNMLEKINK